MLGGRGMISLSSAPALTIGKTHNGDFTQGQNGAAYTVLVSNQAGAGPTYGTVTVTDTVPSGMTLVSMSGGSTWTCTVQPSTCTTSTVLNGGSSYPAITVTVNVAADAVSQVTNQVSLSGGGSADTSASDLTNVSPSKCDINGNQATNVADVQLVIKEALGAIQAVHDLNGDGVVNAVDVQIVMNAALSLGCAAK